MECRTEVPDRKLLARLVLIREEARNMMGGGLLDERNDRGLNTLPESEVYTFLSIPNDIFESIMLCPMWCECQRCKYPATIPCNSYQYCC